MLFNSFDFLIFFVTVFLLQLVLPHRPRNITLLATSYFFYGCWNWRFLSLIIISTLVDFHCGRVVARSTDPRTRKSFVAISAVCNLGLLGFFKYANFFVDSAQTMISSFGFDGRAWHLDIVLPVGISFYTFQTMSYTIDIYRGETKPVKSLIDFGLFVAFFPQLVAGPIERAKNLLPQITRKPNFSLSDFYQGGWLILWGLFKKAVIADNLSIIVDGAFGSSYLSGGDLLIAIYAFAFQIYADFSGYTDIARGAAKMMGYELMLNFRLPYFAVNPRDFWSRWHISLSTWLRDYLYFPLGGNRCGPARTYLNLSVVMLLGGLWHGAAWTFVVWGAYHGVLLIAHRVILQSGISFDPKGEFGKKTWWLLRVVVMFHLTCLGWLIFRSQSFGQLNNMISMIFTNFHFSVISLQWIWQIAALTWPLFLIQILQKTSVNTNVVFNLSAFSRSAVYAVLLIMLISLGNFGGQPFIYFQF